MADLDPIPSRAPFSTWVGVVLLFALFGIIVVAIIGPARRGDSYEEMRAENRVKKLKELRDEDAKALTTYAWIDKNKGTVRLPIDRAMELTLADLSNRKPAPAYPISSPPAGAAPGGQAAASPAPAASPQSAGTPKPVSVSGASSEAGGQPAGAINPSAVKPSTQPGASASPAASPRSSAVPAVSPSTGAAPSARGTPGQQ
jgi:hypothetical protein